MPSLTEGVLALAALVMVGAITLAICRSSRKSRRAPSEHGMRSRVSDADNADGGPPDPDGRAPANPRAVELPVVHAVVIPATPRHRQPGHQHDQHWDAFDDDDVPREYRETDRDRRRAPRPITDRADRGSGGDGDTVRTSDRSVWQPVDEPDVVSPGTSAEDLLLSDPRRHRDPVTSVGGGAAAVPQTDRPPLTDVDDGAEVAPSPLEGCRRGRFALSGNAVMKGQQVVAGVTYRASIDPPPTRWIYGPAPEGTEAGTLVLTVEGCINCTERDVTVLMEPGFAPTRDGFSVRLTAPGPGYFAASGHFDIVGA